MSVFVSDFATWTVTHDDAPGGVDAFGMQIYQTSAAIGHFQFGSSSAGYHTVEANP